MKRLGLGLGLALAGLTGGVAEAQSLRSDSPLWTYPDADLFPRHFSDSQSFGCTVPLGLGVYRVTFADEDDHTFYRIENYGAIHCALVFGESYDGEEADTAFDDYAWLIDLDTLRRPDGTDDHLLALQIGIGGGSRYILLRRHGVELSAPMEQLRWKCPNNAERRRARIDVWSQNACIVTSKTDLRRIARLATRLPVAATWELSPREEPAAQDDQDR